VRAFSHTEILRIRETKHQRPAIEMKNLLSCFITEYEIYKNIAEKTAENEIKSYFAKILTLLVLTIFLPALSNAEEIIKKDLGVRNVSFGSKGQAISMLSLIKNNPHQFKYQISYKTEADIVFFQYDVAMDAIIRIHKRKDGTGTAEKWPGEAMYRLQSAANGGTLLDTKKGRSAGTMTNF
jgi:hypothetical protein